MKNQPEKISNITPLAAFLARHKISLQMLSDICEGAPNCSKSQMARLAKNSVEDSEIETAMRKVLAEKLPRFLLLRGILPAQINTELTEIFTEGEYQPMSDERIELTADAQSWFGLKDDPFKISLKSVNDVFAYPELQQIFDRIIQAINEWEFIAVVGPIGSGKTILRQWLEDYLFQHRNLKLIFPETFEMEKVSPASISRAILEDFDYGKIPIDAVSRAKAVQRVLAERIETKIAIGFDECHKINPRTLSSLKNFLEMNRRGFRKYLGVILFGQPSFLTTLAKSQEIKERLIVLEMPDFKKSSIAYLAHRLALVGGKMEEIFDADALELIELNAQTPLQLGNIANRAMLESMKSPYESKIVRGGIMRAQMTLANTKGKRNLSAVG